MNYLRQRGFTLIELVIVVIIMGIISVVIGQILFQGLQAFQTSNNINEVDWKGFLVLERMKTDIHNIRTAADITTATASQLTFVDVSNSSVQYVFSGSTLTRNGQTLATGLASFSLSYLSGSGIATATPSLVRYITISLSTTQGNMTLPFTTLIGTRVLP